MIGVGAIVLAVAGHQYRRSLQALERQYGQTHRSAAGKLAVFISVMAAVFFVLVWLHK
jgi:uncharacterized oligopeptide transporter (OPT) family protein